MGKGKWFLLLSIFFLLHDVTFSSTAAAINYPLTQIKVNPDCPDKFFKKIYDSICFGLSVYRLDAIKGCSKEDLIKNLGNVILNSSVRFDLENIDIIKKGWTRYSPFSIDNKNFIMRIFLTDEKLYQPDAPVLYEGSIESPAVTFQVLPSLNEILSDRKIKPHKTYSSFEVARSS